MVMGQILWLQSYLEVRCKGHNLVGRLEVHEPPHRNKSGVQDRSEADESQRSRFDPADAQVVIDFSLLARSAPFLSFEKVALWN